MPGPTWPSAGRGCTARRWGSPTRSWITASAASCWPASASLPTGSPPAPARCWASRCGRCLRPPDPPAGTPRRIGVVGHPRYAQFAEALARLVSLARREGAELYFEDQLLEVESGAQPLTAECVPGLELLLTLGGDGTLLRGARMVAHGRTPILGINLGHLGFLTSAAPEEMERALSMWFAGEYELDERMALAIRFSRADGGDGGEHLALNDAVLHKGGAARVIRLLVRASGEEVGTYSADGIILSTPT